MKNKRNNNLRCLSFIVFLMLCILGVSAQGKVIKGVVKDTNDEPIIGANVMVKGTSIGSATSIDGDYVLTVPSSATTLFVSYLGMKDAEVSITGDIVNIIMEEDVSSLDEVVVIGYGSARRKDLTGSTSSVSGSTIAQVPVTTAAQAITGKVAGVNVITQSGAPGADIQITVRGGTSITQGTEPLYIVDGFQMENGLRFVDINDIESIDVMKDASATAIYGARGSNGVILITTKSGKSGKTEVSYNGFVSFDYLGKNLDLLSVEDYVKYQYEFQSLRGDLNAFTNFFGGDINSSDFYTSIYNNISNEYGHQKGIDWQKLVFGNTGFTNNHNVNISGGSEKSKYIISYNYTGEDGIMDRHGFEKNSIRSKINHELWKGIRFDFSSSLQTSKIEGGGSLGGKLKQTILQPITGGVRWSDEELINSDIGTTIGDIMNDANYDAQNPILDNLAITDKKFTRLVNVNLGLEVDLTKDLTFRTAGSYMWQHIRQNYWDDGSTKQAKANKSDYGYGSVNNNERFSWQVTNTLNYALNLGDKHNFNILLGQETYYVEYSELNNEYRSFSDGNFELNDISMGTPYTWTSNKGRSGIVSGFGRLFYNFNDRYLFTGTLRADGSSKFARGHQWNSFPSASAAWRMSEEDFMKDIDYLDNLKLRIGYGTAGNNNISNNMYATNYGSGHYGYNGADFITYVPGTTLGNPDLKWEKTTTSNIGLDMTMLRNRINLSLDLYSNESDNLLISNRIPSSTGYTAQIQNLGAIRNRGIEIILNTINVNTDNFSWMTDFNISFNRSKVLDLYGDGELDYFIQDYSSRMGYKIEVGSPLGQYYGLIYDGIYTTSDFTQSEDGSYKLNNDIPYLKGTSRNNVKAGDVKYKATAGEKDADGFPVFSVNDRTVIGNAQPKFSGGINNTFRYKGFDLNVFMNFVYGNEVFNMSTQRFIGPYMANQNTLKKMGDRFSLIDPSTGKEATNLERLATLNPNQHSSSTLWNISQNNKTAISDHSSYYLEDASFLRLNTITFGYTLPKSLVEQAKINMVRIYCTLNNIHTFTNYSGYDPEVSASGGALTPGIDNSSYPRSKSWVVGLNLTF